MMKKDLRAIQIFHREKHSNDAQLTVVFAALTIDRHMQKVTGLPLKRLINWEQATFDACVPADVK